MRYLLDTCVLSDFARGRPDVMGRLKAASPADLAVSAVTEMEIAYGLQLNPRLSGRLKPVMDALLESVKVLAYDRPAALATAALRAMLKTSGRPIGAYDALIAGTALANDLVLVSSNVREFGRVEALKLENWRSHTD